MNPDTHASDLGGEQSLRLRLVRFAGTHLGRCLILALVGFVVRIPALQGQPIWDDHWLIDDNPFLRSPLLIFEAFRHYLFLDGFSSHYRPVQNVSYALDYVFWNTNPYGYHLTNVLLHVASGLLLYALLRKLIAQFVASRESNPARSVTEVSSAVAFLVSLLWIVHPVHSAAIDYISGRADSLSFSFACGAWLLCFRARAQTTRRASRMHYVAASICALLALCSREIAFVWLCLFLLHLFFFEKQAGRSAKLIAVGCCIVVLGSYALLRQL